MAMTVDDSERGQLLLVLATFIALTIISSVVLLNAIYAPADVGATTERTSLSEAEATTQEVSGHLEELYLESATNESEPVPVLNTTANEDQEFANKVEQYNLKYLEVATQYNTGVVNVTFDPEASADEGFVLRQNNTSDMNDGGGNNHWDVVEGAERVPYIYMNVTKVEATGGGGGNTFTLHMNSADSNSPDTAEYNLTMVENTTESPDGADVIVNGQRVCREALEVPFEFELTNDGIDIGGSGCGNVTSPTYGSFNVDDVYIAQGAGRVEGNYSVMAIGSGLSTEFDSSAAGRNQLENNLIFDPHFRIRYVAPGIRYRANVTALGGDA